MLSVMVHTIVCGIVALTGVVAVVFAVMRGRKLGGGIAFTLGGLGLVLYAGLFYITQLVARREELILAGIKTSGMNERFATALKILSLVDPTIALEPIALLLVMLGFGALARAYDARAAGPAES